MEKNCSKCGELVKVIPPGISKKTGKPYGAFYSCKACGNSQNIGEQPPKQPRPQNGADNAQLNRIEQRLEFAIGRIENLITAVSEPDKEVEIKDETGF